MNVIIIGGSHNEKVGMSDFIRVEPRTIDFLVMRQRIHDLFLVGIIQGSREIRLERKPLIVFIFLPERLVHERLFLHHRLLPIIIAHASWIINPWSVFKSHLIELLV